MDENKAIFYILRLTVMEISHFLMRIRTKNKQNKGNTKIILAVIYKP